MNKIRRRDLVRVVAAAGIATAAATAGGGGSDQKPVRQDKRRPQYQAGSREVQSFYRVNRYPAK